MCKYNQPPKGLFGRYCIIPHGMSKEPFIYRIVNSGVRSNTWIEPPITYQSLNNPVHHDYMEDVIYVVCDTLIDEGSKILKVALKDVELIEDREAEGYISKEEVLREMDEWRNNEFVRVTNPYHYLKKRIEGLDEIKHRSYEYHTDHTDCIWYGSDSGCPVTCSQYRDGWNDAMEYIFKDGKGYQPYRREE